MKTALKAQFGQQLTLTPQLLQSIRLLQLSTPQLELEVIRALETNPMLEREDEDSIPASADEAETSIAVDKHDDALPSEDHIIQNDMDAIDEFPNMEEWGGSNDWTNAGAEDDPVQHLVAREGGDLRQRVSTQLLLGLTDEVDIAAAVWLVDQVEDNGYLAMPLATLYREANSRFGLSSKRIESLRQQMLRGEPTGYGAGDLRECLTVQLEELDDTTPDRETALRLVRDQLELVAKHDLNGLAAALALDSDSISKAIRLILSLQPHPGEDPPDDARHYVIPDVRVTQHNGTWQVTLNALCTPRLRVNPVYEGMLAEAEDAPGAQRLRQLMQEARWLTRGLAMRYDTLLRTVKAIVERQQAFLQRGEEAMLPLTLHEIATAIGMHESTISRITTGKYMQTPRGTFELKHFFPTRLEGASVANVAVRAMVRRLIEGENPRLPLADDTIALMLARQGVRIARRTVAKYRDQLRIAPAKLRHAGVSTGLSMAATA